MFLTISEILSLGIITVVLGYIFSGFIQRPRDPYEIHQKFNWKDLQYAAIIAAPAVILHEMGHKFMAMSFGLEATFYVFWLGLVIAVALKLFNSPLLILAPAYVAFSATASPLQGGLIAFAGPAMNLLIWGFSALVLKYRKNMSQREMYGWAISKKLNFFFFWFNLIPIPPLDGWSVMDGIIGLF